MTHIQEFLAMFDALKRNYKKNNNCPKIQNIQYEIWKIKRLFSNG